jgi:hypothetical protein
LVKRLVSNSKHKRELPPICKIKDWRLKILIFNL